MKKYYLMQNCPDQFEVDGRAKALAKQRELNALVIHPGKFQPGRAKTGGRKKNEPPTESPPRGAFKAAALALGVSRQAVHRGYWAGVPRFVEAVREAKDNL